MTPIGDDDWSDSTHPDGGGIVSVDNEIESMPDTLSMATTPEPSPSPFTGRKAFLLEKKLMDKLVDKVDP